MIIRDHLENSFFHTRKSLQCVEETKHKFPEVPQREELCVLMKKFLEYEERLSTEGTTIEALEEMDLLSQQILAMSKVVVGNIEQQLDDLANKLKQVLS